MKVLDKTHLQNVSGGGFGFDDAVNMWAGYDNWDYSTVVTVNATFGALGGFLGGAKAGSPLLGCFIAPFTAAIAYGYASIEYQIGAYVDARQKEKWADFIASQQA